MIKSLVLDLWFCNCFFLFQFVQLLFPGLSEGLWPEALHFTLLALISSECPHHRALQSSFVSYLGTFTGRFFRLDRHPFIGSTFVVLFNVKF
jgi:hypothetical protein